MSASAWAIRKSPASASVERLSCEAVRLVELAPASENLRADRSPEDPRVVVIGTTCVFAFDGELLGLVPAPLRVRDGRERVGDGREVASLTGPLERVVRRTQVDLGRCQVSVPSTDERVPETDDPDPLAHLVHRRPGMLDQCLRLRLATLHCVEHRGSATHLRPDHEVIPVLVEKLAAPGHRFRGRRRSEKQHDHQPLDDLSLLEPISPPVGRGPAHAPTRPCIGPPIHRGNGPAKRAAMREPARARRRGFRRLRLRDPRRRRAPAA